MSCHVPSAAATTSAHQAHSAAASVIDMAARVARHTGADSEPWLVWGPKGRRDAHGLVRITGVVRVLRK